MKKELRQEENANPEDYCPKCKGKHLSFGSFELADGSIVYPVICPDCKFEGLQVYYLQYGGFQDEMGDKV